MQLFAACYIDSCNATAGPWSVRSAVKYECQISVEASFKGRSGSTMRSDLTRATMTGENGVAGDMGPVSISSLLS